MRIRGTSSLSRVTYVVFFFTRSARQRQTLPNSGRPKWEVVDIQTKGGRFASSDAALYVHIYLSITGAVNGPPAKHLAIRAVQRNDAIPNNVTK